MTLAMAVAMPIAWLAAVTVATPALGQERAAVAGAGGASALCFGAAGPGCATGSQGGPTFCRPQPGTPLLECMVHAGSIEHDTCCRAQPNGKGCGGKPEAPQQCSYEWAKAQDRTTRGLYWTRHLDPREANHGSQVDFDKYCAPAGTVVAAGDERHCCTRAAQAIEERDLHGGNRMRCR